VQRGKRWLWVVGGVLVVAALAVFAFVKFNAAADEAAFLEQLRLARAEGLPTSAAELAATIPTAMPEENAAPFYRRLNAISDQRPNLPIRQAMRLAAWYGLAEVLTRPDARSLADAQAILDYRREELEAIDNAVRLPRCWFDRDWSQGPALLRPEYGRMIGASTLFELRGCMEAQRGNTEAAVAESRSIFTMAKHAAVEGDETSIRVSERIHLNGVLELAYCSFAHRDRPEYYEALRAVGDPPTPDYRVEDRGELLNALWVVENTSTPEKLKDKLGFRAEDLPDRWWWLSQTLVSQTKVKTEVVRAERHKLAAMYLPRDERAEALAKANKQLFEAMSPVPLALKMFVSLGSETQNLNQPDPLEWRKDYWKAARQKRMALVRALRPGPIPTSIGTSDLLSPFDGKPLSYSYDGHQIVIRVSGQEVNGKASSLKIPPDLPKD